MESELHVQYTRLEPEFPSLPGSRFQATSLRHHVTPCLCELLVPAHPHRAPFLPASLPLLVVTRSGCLWLVLGQCTDRGCGSISTRCSLANLAPRPSATTCSKCCFDGGHLGPRERGHLIETGQQGRGVSCCCRQSGSLFEGGHALNFGTNVPHPALVHKPLADSIISKKRYLTSFAVNLE